MGLKEWRERTAFLRHYDAALDEGLRPETDRACSLAAAHARAITAATASCERRGGLLTSERLVDLEMAAVHHAAHRLALAPAEAVRRCVVEPWHLIVDQTMQGHLTHSSTLRGTAAGTEHAIAFALSLHEADDELRLTAHPHVVAHYRTDMLMAATKRWCPIADPSTHDLNVFYFAAMEHAGHATADLGRRMDRGSVPGDAAATLRSGVSAGR